MTDPRQVGLLREALIRHINGDFCRYDASLVAELLDKYPAALAVAPEPVCSCGPWEIGQPEGHLPGCPRAAALADAQVPAPDLEVERLARALTAAGPFGRWLPNGRMDNPSSVDLAADIAAEYRALTEPQDTGEPARGYDYETEGFGGT